MFPEFAIVGQEISVLAEVLVTLAGNLVTQAPRMARRTQNAKWQLHESTQRGLCRAAFVLLGILPLLLAIGFSTAQFVPAYQRARAKSWSDWLSTRLGVEVQVAAVESLAPDRFNLHGIRLAHPESHALLGRVRSVEVAKQGTLWAIDFVSPELEGRQLATTWNMLHDWFMCRPHHQSPPIKIASADLTIRDTAQEQSLEGINIEVYPQAERTLMSIQFRMPDDKADAKPTLLRIARFHSERSLATNLSLETGQSAIPCSLIAPLFPQLKAMGDQAAILGKISLQRRNFSWEMELENAGLTGIDFGQLTAGLEKQVAGGGWIWCQQALITDRGLRNMSGIINVERGRIDQRLLSDGQRYLGVTLPREVQFAQVPLHSFEQLRVTFAISPQQLVFGGLVEKSADGSRKYQPGTIIADAAGELAVSKVVQPLPLQNVVALLSDAPEVSTASVQVPSSIVPGGWLAQKAAWWLPIAPQASATANPPMEENTEVRLSRIPE